MKKKLVLVALVFAMLACLVACGNKETEPEEEAGYGVTLGQYKGIEVTKLVLTVSDDDVEKQVYVNLKSAAAETERTEVKNYDIANIDYTGYLNGEKFSGGEATGTDLMIGSDSFIDGFEDAIIGHSVGETFDINVTFPESYGATDLAGKAVVFTIKINSLKAIPELTDEVIAANTNYKTVEDYYKYVRTSLEENAESTIKAQFESDVLDKVIANCTFSSTLATDAKTYEDNLRSQYESYASSYGIDLETFLYYFLGMTLDNFNTMLPDAAAYNVKLERIFKAVADAENIEITDDEYNEYVEEIMVNYSYNSAAEVEAAAGKENIISSMRMDKAEELILDSAIAK